MKLWSRLQCRLTPPPWNQKLNLGCSEVVIWTAVQTNPPWNQKLNLGCSEVVIWTAVQMNPPPRIRSWTWGAVKLWSGLQCRWTPPRLEVELGVKQILSAVTAVGALPPRITTCSHPPLHVHLFQNHEISVPPSHSVRSTRWPLVIYNSRKNDLNDDSKIMWFHGNSVLRLLKNPFKKQLAYLQRTLFSMDLWL